MAIKAKFFPSAGLLSETGDDVDNTIVTSRDAAGQILVNGGAVSIDGRQASVANTATIQVFGGNDSLDESNGTSRPTQRKNSMSHVGSCFCGAIKIEVSGRPLAMGYCHCGSCRAWSGGPVNAFSLWKPEAVRITSGAEHVATFQKTEMSQRRYCAKCGGHLMTIHPTLGLLDVFAATLPTLNFIPAVHVNYAETVLRMQDGLPKLKDFPAELGGSGEIIAE